MNQMDDSLAMDNPLESYLQDSEGFKIYTHSARTRSAILAMFLAYTVLFSFFLRFIKSRIDGLDDIPAALQGNPDLTQWLFFGIAGLGLVAGFMMLVYFTWWLLDIWGLQVCVNRLELRVQNTLTGTAFSQWTGVGSLSMQDIQTLRGSRLATYVIGKGGRLRFSPVDQVDRLIADIMANAEHAEIEQRNS